MPAQLNSFTHLKAQLVFHSRVGGAIYRSNFHNCQNIVYWFVSGAMAWNVSTTAFEDINEVRRPDRSHWLYDLAYAQWRRAELADGARDSHPQGGDSHPQGGDSQFA
jgi:hypothetical protein